MDLPIAPADLEKFQETWKLLEKFFGASDGQACHRAEGSILPENQVEQMFKTRTDIGQEGLVIRRLNRSDLIKVKPHLTVDAAVVGYVEGEFEGQFGVTSILTALTYPTKKDKTVFFQTLARVGSGLSDAQRQEFRDLFSSVKTEAPIAMTDISRIALEGSSDRDISATITLTVNRNGVRFPFELPAVKVAAKTTAETRVVTVEPGLYYPNIGGVRLEDVVLVTSNSPKNLTQFEKVLEI